MRMTVLLALALALFGPPAVHAQTHASGVAMRPGLPQEAEPTTRRRVPPLELAIQVGFDHRSRGTLPGTWAPVTITVWNHTDKDLHGTLRVTTAASGGEAGGAKVARPVALPAGRRTPLQTTVFVAPGDTRLDVQVQTTAGESVNATDSLLAAPRPMRGIVVVGEASADATAISPVWPHDVLARVTHGNGLSGVPLVGLAAEDGYAGTEQSRYQVLQALPENLPDRWIAYGGVTALILTDPAVADQLTPEQWSAIPDFVRAGGQLVVEVPTPAAAHALELSKRLPPLLPATAGGPEVLSGRQFAGRMQISATLDGEFPVTQLNGDARFGPPFMPTCRLGLGHVTVLGFSMAADPLVANEDAVAQLANNVLGHGNSEDFERTWGAAGRIRQLDYELKSEELAQIPSHKVLLAFLLAYCLAIGPLNRLLFGSTRKPLRPWAALPFLVLGFVGLATTQLGIQRPNVPLLREIAVVQARFGEGSGLARSYLSLYSPDRASYRIAYPHRGTAIQYLTHAEHRGLDRETLAYVDGVGRDQLEPDAIPDALAGITRLDAIQLAPRSTANLAATQIVELGGAIHLNYTSNTVPERFVNGTLLKLEGGLYLPERGGQLDVPAMPPGETAVPGSLSWSKSLQDLVSRTGRDRKALEQLVNHLQQTATRPALLTWTATPVTGLAAKSDRATAQGSSITFFLIHPARGTR